MVFETFTTYELIDKPVRMRILRRPDADLMYYRSPVMPVNDSMDIDEELDMLGEHFEHWLRMNHVPIFDVQRVTMHYSDQSDRNALWEFCGNFFGSDDFVCELIRTEGLLEGASVEMNVIMRKSDE